jgi:site-specific recombinase XerD
MGASQVTAFLNHLATEGRVAAATQNQALAALLFLYQEVLEIKLPWLDGLTRAKRPQRLPTVLTQAEAKTLLTTLEGTKWLMVTLLYGAGMRLNECLAASGLKTSTLMVVRSSFATAKGAKIGLRCCRIARWTRCGCTWNGSSSCTKPIFPPA